MFSGLDNDIAVSEAEEPAAAPARPSAARYNSGSRAKTRKEQTAELKRLLSQLHKFLQDALQQTERDTAPGASVAPITAEGMNVLAGAMLSEPGAQAALAAVHARFHVLLSERPIPPYYRGRADQAADAHLEGSGVGFGEFHETESVSGDGNCLLNS